VPADHARRRNGAHPLEARQAVRRVAAQDREIGVPAAGDLIAPGDLGLVDHGQTRPLRVQHPHARILDEREQVPITAGDLDRAGGQPAPRGDHILRLVLVDPDHVDPDRREQLADHRQLRLEQRRDRLGRPVGLVGREQLDAPARAPRLVVGHGEPARPALNDQPGEPLTEALDRVDLAAVRRTHGGGHAIERAKDHAGPVDQQPVAPHDRPAARDGYRLGSR
jgi:hypothetical protein